MVPKLNFRKYVCLLPGIIFLIISGCEPEKPSTLPELSTLTLTGVTSSSAISGGNISFDGGSSVLKRGVCWSTIYDPTISDNVTTDGAGTGSFSSSITGLSGGTDYYIRAFATNSKGTAYGNEIIFKTQLTDIDGNIYGTIIIGSQVWMSQNLRTTRFSDNTPIPEIADNKLWCSLASPAFCWYSNDRNSDDMRFGALYNWFSVNTGRLCPSGWHVPDDSEWNVLTAYLGGEYYAGGLLKEVGMSHWESPNAGASNYFSFSALPAGYRSGLTSGLFHAKGYMSWWWTNTEYNSNWARTRAIEFDVTDIAGGHGVKRNGYSVRCIRD